MFVRQCLLLFCFLFFFGGKTMPSIVLSVVCLQKEVGRLQAKIQEMEKFLDQEKQARESIDYKYRHSCSKVDKLNRQLFREVSQPCQGEDVGCHG